MDFSRSFGIMCVTNRKERKNDRPEAILPSEINIAQMQDLLSPQSPKTEDENMLITLFKRHIGLTRKR